MIAQTKKTKQGRRRRPQRSPAGFYQLKKKEAETKPFKKIGAQGMIEPAGNGLPAMPKLEKGKLRIIVLGGNEEVGRNCTLMEYDDDIILIDLGLQFPEEDMPGIDYIIPNVSYLKGKEKNVRGVVFSHGHLDHIGAAPILLKKLNYPPIIGRDLTLALIKKKVEEH